MPIDLELTSAPEAIRLIRPGQSILVGSGAAEPGALVSALVEHGEQLADNPVFHILTLGAAPYVEPQHAARLRHCAFFIGPNVRQAVWEGRADFMPVLLSELPELIRSRRVRVDVALIQVSSPDALVPDGATLQVRIGQVPNAVLAALEGRHDLGIHTEMLSDGMMRLSESGPSWEENMALALAGDLAGGVHHFHAAIGDLSWTPPFPRLGTTLRQKRF